MNSNHKYETEFELEESFILGDPLENLDLKFGRQIVVWGTSDNIRVTEVLNPLGLREPGLVDIEFLRLPVTMTKLDYAPVLKTAPDAVVEDEFQTAFGLSRELMNDTLTVTLLAQAFGGNGSPAGIDRLSFEYDLTDAIQLQGGVVFYQSGDLPRFPRIGDNDRLILEFRYHF